MKYKNETGITYKILTDKINNILEKNGSLIRIDRTQTEDYCKSKSTQPRYEDVPKAMAELLNCSISDLLSSIKTCKKGD